MSKLAELKKQKRMAKDVGDFIESIRKASPQCYRVHFTVTADGELRAFEMYASNDDEDIV